MAFSVESDWQVGRRVLAYYANHSDTLKLKAAEYLINNIGYHYSIRSSSLDRYYSEIAQINEIYSYPVCRLKYDSLYALYGNVSDRRIVGDKDCLSYKEIIENIEAAFFDWREGVWARHLSFDEFCEYLLPYRVCNEQYEKDWRETLRKEFLPYTDDIKYSDDMRLQSYWAAFTIANELRKRQIHNLKVLPQLNADYPVSALRHIQMGECYDYGKITTYIMRACGIPVSLDFTPQWPDRARNHHWNALFDNTRRVIPFMGYELPPGYPSKNGWRKAKVYRYMFAYQPQSLYAMNKNIGQRIPDNLNSPFYKDVSDEYFESYNVEIKLNNKHLRDSFAYIAVFNNQEWVPVDFARIGGNRTVTFQKMGGDIVYMPVYWSGNGCIPAGDAFILDVRGNIKTMKPNMKKTQTVIVDRKYPLFNRISNFWKGMIGGRIEASDSSDFSNSEIYGVITDVHFHGPAVVKIENNKDYRYWRFISPKDKACNIASIQFLSNGTIVSPFAYLCSEQSNRVNNAFDDNRLSYYEGRQKGGWIGVDFGTSKRIDEVKIMPRNDDNEVVAGHTYELCYFDEGREVSMGMKVATDTYLVYDGAPTNAVFVLHDKTGGTEERIFYYQDNELIWY